MVKADGVDATAVLDGFTIASGGFDLDAATDGGAIWLNQSSATFRNLYLVDNHGRKGGAVWIGGGQPTFFNVVVYRNAARFRTTTQWGSAVFLESGAVPTFTNVTIVGNIAWPGGISFNAGDGSTPIVWNSIIVRNNGTGALYGRSSDVPPVRAKAFNSIFSSYLSCGYELDCANVHWNADEWPLFIDVDNGDLRLAPGSEAIDAGNNAFLPSGTAGATDIDGNPRIVGGTVDLGAYERQQPE